jgi:MFS family permease
MTSSTALRLGPVTMEPGIERSHVNALLFACFVTIGIATGIAAMTPFVLTANLGLPEGDQGKALGSLALWQEITLILVYTPLGVLADKIGRRAVYALGLVTVGVAYALYPFATTLTELSLFRVIYAVGIGAATGMLSTVIADYASVNDRGKMTAIGGFLNGLGVVLVTLLVGKLPALFAAGGATQFEAGRDALFVLAAICMVSGLVLWFTLKPGLPAETTKRIPASELFSTGLGAARTNRRIALAYAAAFVARGDLAIVGLFAIAWGKLAAVQSGLAPAQALEKGIIPFVVAQSTALFWPVVIILLIDKLSRVTALTWCMTLGAIGYLAMGFVTDPLDPIQMIPFFMLLGIGQISAFLGAQTIIAKEAPPETRGSVIGAFNLCGALGILVLSVAGGWLFDHVGPAAPFVMVGICNGAVALASLFVQRAEAAGR